AGNLNRRAVVDITNPLTPDYMGLAIGHTTSAAEEIQKAFPGAKVVKAFNTVFAQVLADGPKLADATVPVFFAGDDAAAKELVRSLIESMGFIPVDAGGLKNARYLEPLAGLNIYFGRHHFRGLLPSGFPVGQVMNLLDHAANTLFRRPHAQTGL